MVASLDEQLKLATIPARLNIQDILDHFDPSNSSLFAINSTAFEVEDYSEEDAKIADTIADPLELPSERNDHAQNSIDENSVPVIEVWKDSDGGTGSTNATEHNSKENTETNWENDEYRKQIKLYRERKNRNHLFATMEERNLTPCDLYLRCRHQVIRGLDTCGVLSGRGEQQTPFALSTESLLEIGDHCEGEGYDTFNRLYELVILRNKHLRKCLNQSALVNETKCASDHNVHSRKIADRLSMGNYTNANECYSDVNSLQFICAQLRPCCPYFFRCREQTSNAEIEGEILSLTSKLAADNHRCLHRVQHVRSDATTTGNRMKHPISQRISHWAHPTRKMTILPSDDVRNAIVRHSFPPDSKKS
ncbi:unnamed protein product [Toxocara canis]|uniref:SERTA domain-containing protein n=1 Tax=Toxocara canis TaxID=6265 RepID=A0A183VBS5_TOXCA|nr:unnamed protein product [Toxocara canis]